MSYEVVRDYYHESVIKQLGLPGIIHAQRLQPTQKTTRNLRSQ